jgi:DNA replicative helicase MCM subunit Mcm2 (Cdc46/Mcm family)
VITLYVENGEAHDFPRVYFSGNKAEKAKEFKKGERVIVQGSLHTHLTTSKSHIPFVEQIVIGNSIDKLESSLSQVFGVDDGAVEFKNELLLSGLVSKVASRNGVTIVTILPDDESQLVQVESFVASTSKLFADCKFGAHICVKCELHTKRSERNGEVRFFQNAVVRWLNVDKPVI